MAKLKLRELSNQIIDLILLAEGVEGEEHVKAKKIRGVWHALFFSSVCSAILVIIVHTILRSIFPLNSLVAMLWRFSILAIFVFILWLLVVLGVRYYKLLLRTSKDLRFQNIVFFFTGGILLFGYIYRSIYAIKPSYFTMTNPLAIPEPYLMQQGWLSIAVSADFFVYSATVMLTLSYPRIESASFIISLVNVAEVIYGITIVVLLIATLVQKIDKRQVYKNNQ